MYCEITIKHNFPDDFTDLLMNELGEIGFESFVEDDGQLLSYIKKDILNISLLTNVLKDFYGYHLDYSMKELEDQNWNAIWESNYSPVQFGDFCTIRAPFHPKNDNVRFDLIIEPKMSFGTAHHETTSLMIEWMSEIDFVGKDALDMGCGTGVLAILAEKLGAKNITAIDIDQWSYENTLENIEKNACIAVKALHGDASLLSNISFHTILANINRNILLNDIPTYAHCLKQGGLLFLSGFYKEDIPSIEHRCKECGLELQGMKEKNNWVALKMIKL